jgi:hypothetical protein
VAILIEREVGLGEVVENVPVPRRRERPWTGDGMKVIYI